ncbi:unnamed protein product [Calicophoron daubneyi]|uniref:Uncharacterized protein n=1 Tax=Calicophoron daubneyi TaxID=300641 RepID=A0AAV2TBW8_CALDB
MAHDEKVARMSSVTDAWYTNETKYVNKPTMAKFGFCLFLSFVQLLHLCDAANWAVLVAGTETWKNYRHQANVGHMNYLLLQSGFPQENIVVMMFDNIINDERNKNKELEVNVKNFLDIMNGDENLRSSGRKVLLSNRDDNVFLFFSGYSSNSLLRFRKETLHADVLDDLFDSMTREGRYSNMYVVINGDQAGSILEKIDWNGKRIYATAGAMEGQKSYAHANRVFPDLPPYASYFTVAWFSAVSEVVGGMPVGDFISFSSNSGRRRNLNEFGEGTSGMTYP